MSSFTSYLAVTVCLLSPALAAIDATLVGTWTTKSAAVLTGPGFYNPINDSFIEPSLTGISYSFTADGFYESAYYRAISNPTTPTCPSSVMQFQHGTVVANTDGSLILTPISVDGRELLSSPCTTAGKKGFSTYIRYNQVETMEKWQVSKDAYSGATRLDLYAFDGSAMNPMYLAYRPPIMLPTQTMNPTKAAAATATAAAKVKRWLGMEDMGSLEGRSLPLNKEAQHVERGVRRWSVEGIEPGVVWWMGIGMTVVGGAAYLL